MSKLGRYSADRKKVKQLAQAVVGYTASVAACGTHFMLNGSSMTSDVTHNLPHPADAGAGWWCRFTVEATGATISQLDLGGDDVLIKVRAQGNTDGTSLADDLIVVNLDGVASGPITSDQDADFITFKGETVAGSYVDFYTDASLWYATGQVVTGSGGMITVDS